LRLKENSRAVPHLAELMALESRCCPFLTMSVAAQGDATVVEITGGAGIKEFIAAEFGVRPRA
jgi:hypothetical protein